MCDSLCPKDCSTPGFPVPHYWYYKYISSSVTPFSSCPQSFPTSEYFAVSQFFSSGSQSTGTSALASVFPMNIQGWFPLGLTVLISLQSKGLSRVSWTTKRSNQSILKEIHSEYSLEGLMLMLKLQSFGYLMQRADSLDKTLMLGKIEGRRKRGQPRMR